MGILDLAEEAAGAFVAEKALGAVDPNAGFLAEAAAAVAGFEGVKMAKEHFADSEASAPEGLSSDNPQATDDTATDATA